VEEEWAQPKEHSVWRGEGMDIFWNPLVVAFEDLAKVR